ncbi:MAG: MspA family porin [Gordonia sp. (in: high G+C Gram-positive bacteria)]
MNRRALCAVVALVVATEAAFAGAPGASALPPLFGSSEPPNIKDRTIVRTTADGWRLEISKTRERINSVPPLNQSPWSREGYTGVRGSVKILGHGRAPVNAGRVSSGIHIGCNTSVESGATFGLWAGPTAQMSISYPPAAIVGFQAMPNVSTTLRPGQITIVAFGDKSLASAQGGVGMQGVHIKVDGCLGPVAIRTFVRVAISTDNNDDTFHIYGKPNYL